jgi:hypothetical protein
MFKRGQRVLVHLLSATISVAGTITFVHGDMCYVEFDAEIASYKGSYYQRLEVEFV